MAGAVQVNGRRVRIASQSLPPGARVEVGVDAERLFDDATSRDNPFELTASRILFEDDDLIVVDKPAGLPAHPTLDQTRDSLLAAVGRFLVKRDGRLHPYLGVHQRLDRDTSGVVLFTRSKRVNADVAEIFSKHLGHKTYHALTVHRAKAGPPHWSVRNYLGKVSSKGKRAKYGAVRAEGEFAETSFRVIAESPRGLWIEASPKTGRTHQIRVHLSEYGLPILGDDLYGVKTPSAPRLMLHAAQLVFPHPITKRELSVISPLPDDFTQRWRQLKEEKCPLP